MDRLSWTYLAAAYYENSSVLNLPCQYETAAGLYSGESLSHREA